MTLDFILRIVCGSLLGGVIGLEREYRAKEAGFRTHFLVALGSTLFMGSKHMMYPFTAHIQFIKQVYNLSAGITENGIYPLFYQCLNNYFST